MPQTRMRPPISATDAEPEVLLFISFRRLPPNPEPLLKRLESASGINAGDLRYRIVGHGLHQLTPTLQRDRQHALLDEMQDMGIPAVVVPKQQFMRRIRLALARQVEITESQVQFFNRNGEEILTVDAETELLVIVADLAGKKRKQTIMDPDIQESPDERSFETALKRASLGRPVVVFCRPGNGDDSCVLLEHSSFQYISMGDVMQASAAANFRTLVLKTMDRAKSCIADHGFALTTLSRAAYDQNSSQKEILGSLGRYTNAMLAAAEAGLIHPETPMAADFTYNAASVDPEPGTLDFHESEAALKDEEARREPSGPKPPPPVQHTGFVARLFSTPLDLLLTVLFFLPSLVPFFLQPGHHGYPMFWKALFGGVLAVGGPLLFSYGLVMLYYKRMVENTPTSKVRSMAMGMVEITGQARQYYDLKTAFSQTRCIYFTCRYYRKKRVNFSRRSMQSGETWVLEREVASGRLPFYIEDETGRALVRPKGALLLATKSRQRFSGGLGMWIGRGNPDTRVDEALIPEGARIYVLGKARPERVGSPVEELIVNELRALKNDRTRLQAYDANNDGRIDMEEWETARRDAENKVYADILARGAPEERTVIGKPLYGMLPFIIADSEKAIIRKLKWRSLMFLGVGIFMLASGSQMLVRLYIQ